MSNRAPLLDIPPAPPLPGAATGARFAGLDGMRAIAVLLVVTFHLFPGVLPGGFIGVDIFFVISGFLITSLLLREQSAHGSISFRRFWQRRARRLIPALAVVVVVSSTLAWVLGKDLLVGIGLQILGALTFSYNWIQVAAGTNYFTAGTPELFRNFWSLAVEEQFYIVWPVLLVALLLIIRASIRTGIVVVGALASAGWMIALSATGADATRLYYGTDTHAFGLLLGAALALFLHARASSPDAQRTRIRPTATIIHTIGIAALAGILVFSWILRENTQLTFRGGLFLVALLTTVLIWSATRPGSKLGTLLDARPLRYIGERSYGIYLWHWPLLILTAEWMPINGIPTDTDIVVTGIIALLLTSLAAVLSYRYVEQPIRRHGFRGTLRRYRGAWRGHLSHRIVAGIGFALVGALVLGTTLAVVSAPRQSSAQEAIERGAAAMSSAPTGPATTAPSATPTAPPRTIPSGDQITAIGDSVMLAAAPELQERFPGISIDATVSRSMLAAPGILRSLADAGQLRQTVVIGLGTNGPIREASLREIFEITGPDRIVILVDAYGNRSWIPGVNDALRGAVANHPNAAVANWSEAVAPLASEVLAGDGIHPTSRGGRVYTESIYDGISSVVRTLRRN